MVKKQIMIRRNEKESSLMFNSIFQNGQLIIEEIKLLPDCSLFESERVG